MFLYPTLIILNLLYVIKILSCQKQGFHDGFVEGEVKGWKQGYETGLLQGKQIGNEVITL